MNTSVPWSIKDISFETREAAREAARRAGMTLGEWLDTAIAERAAEPELSRSKADNRERLDAVASELYRLGARDASQAQDLGATGTYGVAAPVPTVAPDAPRPASDPLRIMSERLADLERRSAPRSLDGPDRSPHGDSTNSRSERPARSGKPVSPDIREAIAEIARRQTALESDDVGLDAAPEPEPADEAESTRRRRWRDRGTEARGGLADEPATTTQPPAADAAVRNDNDAAEARPYGLVTGLDDLRQDLRQAIQDIDPRGDVKDLNHQLRTLEGKIEAVAAIMPPGSVLSAIGDQTREMRDLLTAAAATRPGAADKMQQQIEDLHSRFADPSGSRQKDPSRADALSEVRSLLDRVASGSAVETLDQRVRELSAKIDEGQGRGSSIPLLEELARRIDHIQTSIGTTRASSVDTRPLEALVRGIGERIDDARLASTNIQQLERTMGELAEKIETSRTTVDTQALEAQISRLGNRLEQSEASLSALDSVERTLGELFSQLEETRHAAIDAAENAARTAARDTLRAAMSGQATPLQDQHPAAFDEVRQVLSEVRDQHDASDRRTQSTLLGLHQTMEKLVGHLAKLDIAERGQPADLPATEIPAPEPSRPEPVAPKVQAEPSYQEKFRQEKASRRTVVQNDEAIDSLIEPGAGRSFRENSDDPAQRSGKTASDAIKPPTRDGQGPASYIAAARRAAQAAQVSAAAQKQSKSIRGVGASEGAPVLSRARQFLALRRRPILLSIAALVLMLGALEVVKIGFEEPSSSGRVGSVDAPATATAPARLTRQASPVPDSVAVETPVAANTDPAGQAPDAKPTAEAKVVTVAPSSNPFLAGLEPSAQSSGDGLRKLAASGDPAAQYELGLRYAEGRTFNRDPKVAAGWFEKAATQGLAPAQYRIGSAYEKGIGVIRDPARAMTWYGRAADAGNIKAMHNLAVMSADGSLGKSDYAKAASWFAKAAALGVRDSQFNLAILYAKGLGIEQSLTQSYTWFAIAAAQGDDDAGKKRDEVGAKLDAKSLAAAKEAAEAFRPGATIGAANDVAAPPGGWDAAPATRGPAGAQKGSASKVTTM